MVPIAVQEFDAACAKLRLDSHKQRAD